MTVIALPGVLGGGAGALPGLTLSFFDDATARNNVNITLPTGIIADTDVIVLWTRSLNASGIPAEVTPAGFTRFVSGTQNSSNDTRANGWFKIADADDSGDSLTAVTLSSNMEIIVHVYRASIPITTVTPQQAVSELTNGDPATQVKTTPTLIAPLLVFGAYHGANIGSAGSIFSGDTPDAVTTVGADDDEFLKSVAQNPGDEVNVIINMGDEGSFNVLQGWVLEIA